MSDAESGDKEPKQKPPLKPEGKFSHAWKLVRRGLSNIFGNTLGNLFAAALTSAALLGLIKKYYSSATQSLTTNFLVNVLAIVLIVTCLGALAAIAVHLLRHERTHRHTREAHRRLAETHGGLSKTLSDEREKYSREISELKDGHAQAQEGLTQKHLDALNGVEVQIKELEALDRRKILTMMSMRRFATECERNDLSFFRSFSEVAFNGETAFDPTVMNAIGERVVAYIHLEIQSTVDALKEILDVLTGDECAVCIKHVLNVDPAKEITAATLETTYRDKKSAELRGENDQKAYAVDSNTITMKIIAMSRPFWGKDNLWAEFEAGRYKNSRDDWHAFYNATIGAAILSHQDRKFPRLKNCGLLCADNKVGRLNDEFAVAVMRIFAARLGLLLFRMRNLVAELHLVLPGRTY
jgi:hypothetical protein